MVEIGWGGLVSSSMCARRPLLRVWPEDVTAERGRWQVVETADVVDCFSLSTKGERYSMSVSVSVSVMTAVIDIARADVT